MNSWTLKQKFRLGVIVCILVSLVLMACVPFLGKGAWFHYVERNHMFYVMEMAA